MAVVAIVFEFDASMVGVVAGALVVVKEIPETVAAKYISPGSNPKVSPPQQFPST